MIWNRYLFVLLLGLTVTAIAPARDFSGPPTWLVTGDHYAPFTDRRLPNGGLISDLVTQAFQAMGREVKIRYFPWRRAFMGVERGMYAATFPHFHTEDLDRDYEFSDLIYPIRQRIYVAEGSPLRVKKIRDLANLRLCSPIGHVVHEQLQNLVYTATISIISPPSMHICAKMMARGRVDFMVMDETVYRYVLGGNGLQPIGPALEGGLHLLLPKNAPQSLTLLWEFNTGLKFLKQCGRFDRIVNQHLGRGEMEEVW